MRPGPFNLDSTKLIAAMDTVNPNANFINVSAFQMFAVCSVKRAHEPTHRPHRTKC